MTYRAPLKDMLFVMKELAGIEAVAALPGYEDAGLETAAAVLEECARFNEQVVAPLNWDGDRDPSSFHDGEVRTMDRSLPAWGSVRFMVPVQRPSIMGGM